MKSVLLMKLDIEVPSLTIGNNKTDWCMSELHRSKGRSKVMINSKKRKDSGPTFTLKTYNRFNVLKSDDDEHDIKNSSDGLLSGESTKSAREIVEVGDPLTKNKVISDNKFSLLLRNCIELTLIFLLLILY